MLEVAADVYGRPLSAILRETEHLDEFTELVELRRMQNEEAEARRRNAAPQE